MTPQEVKLWVHLRSWKKRGFHFRRRVPRDGFILDFVSLRDHLIIEIDGGQHNEDAHTVRDRNRDAHFQRLGLRVLRFWNNDVDGNLAGVLETIDRELRRKSLHPVGFADHPPPLGEG